MLTIVHRAAAGSARPRSSQPLNPQKPSGCVEKGRGHTGNMSVNKSLPRQVVSVLFPFLGEHLPAGTPAPHTRSQSPLQHHSPRKDGLQESPKVQRPRPRASPRISQMNLSGWSPVSLDWTEGRQRRSLSPCPSAYLKAESILM